MASLVAPLASGIAGAASGSAVFYRTGTSTLASVYSDAEGVTAVTTHTLDANGGISRYVEERVDVVVLSSAGATVRTFTWGTDAREMRVENAGFTGTLANGQTAAGGRTTLDTVLTRLTESLGTTDGNVLVNGAVTTLSLALSSSAGLVYNVKSGYGATGNGTTNDGPAIQLAINAADAAGGGIIYFPHGTYRIGTALVAANSTGKFFFLGEAASGTFLEKDDDVTTMLTLGNSNTQTVMNITFKPASAADTGTLVAVGSSARATFISCAFSALNGTTLALTAASTSRANLFGCTIAQAGASSRIASGDGAVLRMTACDITTSGADLTCFSDSLFVISNGCDWTLGSAIAAGTTTIFNDASGTLQIIGGQVVSAFTSGTVTICTAGGLVTSSVLYAGAGATMTLSSGSLIESGCGFSGAGAPTIGAPTSGYSTTRQNRINPASITGTTYAPSGAYGIHELTHTSGASMAFGAPSPAVLNGWPFVIIYKNATGGNITPTFDASSYTTLATIAQVDNGKVGVYYFIPKPGTITTELICISAQPAGGITP